jgi:CRP/FNR family cyclic AMP-dependent transcriptional regulator
MACRRTSRVRPPGTVLFTEGDLPDGLHILESGAAVLHGSTSQGKTIVIKTAHVGEMLGLNAILLERPYLFSAKVTEPSRVAYVRRNDFLKFLDQSPETAKLVMNQLSANYYDAQRELCTLSLASNTAERMARLLIGWVEESEMGGDDEVWIDMDLTHDQIAQMIGTTRETVSRILTRLGRGRIIEVKGHVVRIPSVARLRQLAGL